MNKEQTPIEKELKEWSPLKFNGEMKWRNEDVIEFSNAKVLEALEKVTGQIKHLPMSDLPKHLFAEVIHDIGMEVTKQKLKD